MAPIIGGWLFVHIDWHAIFWFLAAVGLVLGVSVWRLLPETLPDEQRQSFAAGNLFAGYMTLLSDPRFILLALASGVPFNGMFLYVLSAPAFLGELLGLGPQQFFWFFLLTIGGIMGGAWVSGRLAGRVPRRRQVRLGFIVMFTGGLLNLAANLLFEAHASWAMLPVALFTFGWALNIPVVTLMVLDLHPTRRGMASSLQSFVASMANGLVAGLVAPLVMHSTVALASTALLMLSVGLFAWLYLRYRWPEVVRLEIGIPRARPRTNRTSADRSPSRCPPQSRHPCPSV